MYRFSHVKTVQYGEGGNLLLQGSVLRPPAELKALYGQAQCVYLDPPFMTGRTLSRKRPLGEKGWKKGTPTVKLEGFEDDFENEREYLRLLRKLVTVSRSLLRDEGIFYLHLDWRMSAQARLLCDKTFGKDAFLNEIIWSYESGGRSKRFFPRKHDTILMYARSDKYRFNLEKVGMPRQGNRKNHMARGVDENGRTYSSIKSNGKIYRYYDDEPVFPSDVWNDISILQQKDPERTGYATQKPMKLMERLLKPVAEPGELVVDLCCGSGTTLAAAQDLGLRYAGMDVSPAAVAVSWSRLKTENLRVLCPCGQDGAELLAEYDREKGRLRIHGLRISEGPLAEADPLDALESWETGHMEKDVFRPERTYRRSFQYPALVDEVRMAEAELPEAILTTDAAGVRRLYRLERSGGGNPEEG